MTVQAPEPTFTSSSVTKLVGVPICPDLLEVGDLGVADSWRGHLVRLALRLLGPGVESRP